MILVVDKLYCACRCLASNWPFGRVLGHSKILHRGERFVVTGELCILILLILDISQNVACREGAESTDIFPAVFSAMRCGREIWTRSVGIEIELCQIHMV